MKMNHIVSLLCGNVLVRVLHYVFGEDSCTAQTTYKGSSVYVILYVIQINFIHFSSSVYKSIVTLEVKPRKKTARRNSKYTQTCLNIFQLTNSTIAQNVAEF